MKTVNSISGGKTSAYMAINFPTDINIFACVCIDYEPAKLKDKTVEKYVLEKLNGNFIASAEREQTLKVLMDLEQVLGENIVWVRGKSFDQIIKENSALPTWKRRFCTSEMKIQPIFDYLYPRYGITQHNIGFRADELERIKKGTINRQMKFVDTCNLYGQNRQNWVEKDWQIKSFPLNRTFHYQIKDFLQTKFPKLNFPNDSNCVGCHHKSQELINFNYKTEPKILDWFALQEEKKLAQGGIFHTWHDDKIPYRQIFKNTYTNLFSEIDDHTMCNSGGCTD